MLGCIPCIEVQTMMKHVFFLHDNRWVAREVSSIQSNPLICKAENNQNCHLYDGNNWKCIQTAIYLVEVQITHFKQENILHLYAHTFSLVPRPSTPPVFDRLQYWPSTPPVFDCLHYCSTASDQKTGGVEGTRLHTLYTVIILYALQLAQVILLVLAHNLGSSRAFQNLLPLQLVYRAEHSWYMHQCSCSKNDKPHVSDSDQLEHCTGNKLDILALSS